MTYSKINRVNFHCISIDDLIFGENLDDALLVKSYFGEVAGNCGGMKVDFVCDWKYGFGPFGGRDGIGMKFPVERQKGRV
jgi:hypothetical protein